MYSSCCLCGYLVLNIHRKLVDWEWMTIMIIQVPQSRHMSAGGIMTSWTWSRLKQTHFHVFLHFLHHNSYLYEHGWPCLDLYIYYDEFSTGFQVSDGNWVETDLNMKTFPCNTIQHSIARQMCCEEEAGNSRRLLYSALLNYPAFHKKAC